MFVCAEMVENRKSVFRPYGYTPCIWGPISGPQTAKIDQIDDFRHFWALSDIKICVLLNANPKICLYVLIHANWPKFLFATDPFYN